MSTRKHKRILTSRRIYFFCCLIMAEMTAFLFSGLVAQSLSFSRVILVSNVEDTVPAGKSWKVESFHQDEIGITSGTSQSCSSGYLNPYMVNGIRYYNPGNIATGYGAWGLCPGNHFPFWLPAGTRLATGCSGDFLSVIEFNITP